MITYRSVQIIGEGEERLLQEVPFEHKIMEEEGDSMDDYRGACKCA